MTRIHERRVRLAVLRSRLTKVLALVVFLVTAGTVAPSAAFAASSVVQFQRVGTPVCIQQTGGNETPLVESLCSSSAPGQRWTWLTGSPGGSKFIPSSAPLSCLNVQGSSRSAGAKIVVSDCASDLSQAWLIFSTLPSGFILKNANSGLCVTRTVAGIVQQPCVSGTVGQAFLINTV